MTSSPAAPMPPASQHGTTPARIPRQRLTIDDLTVVRLRVVEILASEPEVLRPVMRNPRNPSSVVETGGNVQRVVVTLATRATANPPSRQARSSGG